MLVLGVTADEKGEQLEQLVRTILTSQGYENVRSNVVRAGGNELDIVAVRRTELMGEVHEVPLMGEAKAYADPVTTPTWQKFLGKLFIERAGGRSTVGVLIALNGVNGPVAGSANDLKKHDASLYLFEGVDLIKQAISTEQLVDEGAALEAAAVQFGRSPIRTDIAYHKGAYFWLLHWNDEEYSIVSGSGSMLLAEEVEKLRPACEASVSGTLLATDEVLAEAQARHAAKLVVMNRLFAGEAVALDEDSGHSQAIASLVDEPFTQVFDRELRLVPAEELDAASVSRLFVSIFENSVKISLLRYMVDALHVPYIERLVQLLPDLQSGFSLGADDAQSLARIANLFPSVQVLLARPIPMITSHRAQIAEVDEAMELADKESFWAEVVNAVRRDYGNTAVSGFLYDYLGVAELEVRTELVVKTKAEQLGRPIHTESRLAVRQYTDDKLGDDAVHVMIKILPGRPQPWEDDHPSPAFPLE